jgi:hypothetical protein
MNNWLEKYQDGGYLGTTNVGREYSPAWGGQFDMGGNIPGSVGFTYARTGDIPDNGKYAKKTLASAQNGKEMQFYQEGLDFQPKTISQNGSFIPPDNRARGDMQSYYPQIARMYDSPQRKALAEATAKRQEQERARRIIESQPSVSQYTPVKDLEAANRYKFAKQYAATHGGYSDEQGNYTQGLLGDMADSKLAAKTWDNIVVPGFEAEMLVSGAGLVGKGLKAAGKYAVENTALKNAYKLNPWAFKPNPEAYYHRSPNIQNIVNQETGNLQGFGQSEAGQAYNELAKPGMGNTLLSDGTVSRLNLRKPANSELYFSKGVPLDWGRYNPETFNQAGKRIMTGQGYPGPYIVEVADVPFIAKTNGKYSKVFDSNTGEYVRGALPPTNIESYAVSKRPISLDETKFYKEDWLRGYKELPKQKQGGVIKDDRGQWAHPGKDGLELTKLDQLTNWSNYNKSTKGGWLDYYKDGGDIPISSNGVYDYPKQEVIVPTLDGSITMNSIKYPIFGVDEFGNKKIMKPNKNYQFPGRIIHEIPILKNNEKDKRKNSRIYKK